MSAAWRAVTGAGFAAFGGAVAVVARGTHPAWWGWPLIITAGALIGLAVFPRRGRRA